MARPNRPRSIASEAAVSRRIAIEIERRNLKPASLAQRMTSIGCPINTSAIYKIISPAEGQTPRRITVDELVAFAQVLDLEIEELMQPPELIEETELVAMLERYAEIGQRLRDLIEEDLELWSGIVAACRDRPELKDLAESLLKRSADDQGLNDHWLRHHVTQVRRGSTVAPGRSEG